MELIKVKEGTYELTKDTYLRKTRLGVWRIIRPVKIRGELHWPNLLYGGKISNIIILLVLISIILFSAWSYERDIRECKYMIENPPRCEYRKTPGLDFNYSDVIQILNVSNKAGDHELNLSLHT